FASAAPEALEAVSSAIVPLGQGAMFTALVWCAILVFIIDQHYSKAAITALVGAVLSSIGLIHAPELNFFYNPSLVLSYLLISIYFVFYHKTNTIELVKLIKEP